MAAAFKKPITPGTLVGVGAFVNDAYATPRGGGGGSRSTKGWRLRATDRLVIPMHGKSGVTSGAIDPSLGLGRSQRTAEKPLLSKSQKRRHAKKAARTLTGR
jgi:hypothetical protein